MKTPADAEMADGQSPRDVGHASLPSQGTLLFFNNRAAAQHT
jgi:hypothetical protein